MNLIFRSHAIKRMFERNVRPEDVRHVLITGKAIREYPDDTPFPSRLILGWVASKPLHVVVAEDAGLETSIILQYMNQTQLSGRRILKGSGHEMSNLQARQHPSRICQHYPGAR
jgi:hypothetical protein